MALTSGFFNSISGDRVYNADQISSMFEGLISDGIDEDVDDAYQVTASSGMTLNVGTGRAMVNSKWAKNTSPIAVTINPAHVLLDRYTAIVLRLDISGRTISVATIDGEASSTPAKPSIVRNGTYYDLLLAYVSVHAGATSIAQGDIEDQRANTTYCGWVTGLITQVDTSTLFLQWQTAYEAFFEQMVAWKDAQQEAYESWFDTLTQDLQVNTYIVKYHKFVSLADTDSRVITLDIDDYSYDSHDVFIVSLNGLKANEGTDYTLNSQVYPPQITMNYTPVAGESQDVDILIMHSKIGNPVRQPSTSVVETTNITEDINMNITIE